MSKAGASKAIVDIEGWILLALVLVIGVGFVGICALIIIDPMAQPESELRPQ